MKYFALLTKLGENLLAQATALGTKLELTHMAVGDGGGSLPTPDTNQTKLIAEKRRAAINTLFIDDKNKNQIIAEQIIPEQDGGWWIREIGLFDKAGNLIAVANCPETYKPQLAEGSGRTQSIRMVLIVSHTESVTLKIDPSVVLATREYVNTEITVLDKKIDALSAQTKLDLNKKFDKANISGQKGNDNDKVPSLNLFTTEIGKLAALGYSYSKIESDGRYQPKGNYAPAGDYATNTALNSGLNAKFDKTGGVVTGVITATQRIESGTGDVRVALNSYGAVPDILSRRAGAIYHHSHKLPDASGTLMQVGDYGLGATSSPDAGLTKDWGQNGFFFGRKESDNSVVFGISCNHSNSAYSFNLYARNGHVFFITKEQGISSQEHVIYSTRNTKTDRNGYLKISTNSEDMQSIPIGSSVIWNSTAPIPENFWPNEGRSFSATEYPELAKIYPNLKLPDDRGYAIRIADNGRGIDAGRTVGTYQDDAMQKIVGSLDSLSTADSSSIKASGAFTNDGDSPSWQMGVNNRISKSVISFDSGRVTRTANETRMKNVAKILITRVK